jgi:hypothetical protein
MRNGFSREIIGCYALFRDRDRPIDSKYYHGVPRVELDTVRISVALDDSLPGVFRVVRRLDTAGYRRDSVNLRLFHVPVWWSDSLSDTVRLSFSDGFSGAYLALSPRRGSTDTLAGRVENHWDYGGPTDRRSALAIRFPCRKP